MRAALVLAAVLTTAMAQTANPRTGNATPLAIGETFTIESTVLGETRRINVYLPPPVYGEALAADRRLPVLYMPDGGVAEDFVHIAGLVQVLSGNAGMRPFLLVGIENTVRRRDLTGPTSNAEDKKAAPQAGGAAAFRTFIRTELKPIIASRYRITDESGIIGESLAGFFVVDTLFAEPDLFDSYIAVDPSVWWNDSELATRTESAAPALGNRAKTLYVASSREDRADATARLAAGLGAHPPPNLRFIYAPMPEETHATIYHPAALRALRQVFKPEPVELEIYEALLRDLLGRSLPSRLLIQGKPRPLWAMTPTDWQSSPGETAALRARATAALAAPASSEPFTLGAFPTGAALVTQAELDELRKTPTGVPDGYWRAIRDRWRVASIQSFSRPIVTEDGLQALVAYAHGCGSLCGEAGFAWLYRASRSDPWSVKRIVKVVA